MTRPNRIKTLLALTASFLATVSVRADVTLNAIFNDHMALQRGIPVEGYGTAEPGEKLTVAFTSQTWAATADKEGAWCVKLAAMKASTDAAMMTVTGRNKLTLSDVVVGDVWLCSGQSNMDFTPDASNGPEEQRITVPKV